MDNICFKKYRNISKTLSNVSISQPWSVTKRVLKSYNLNMAFYNNEIERKMQQI